MVGVEGSRIRCDLEIDAARVDERRQRAVERDQLGPDENVRVARKAVGGKDGVAQRLWAGVPGARNDQRRGRGWYGGCRWRPDCAALPRRRATAD